jgi:Putative zinc-binding metallo-peptidase
MRHCHHSLSLLLSCLTCLSVLCSVSVVAQSPEAGKSTDRLPQLLKIAEKYQIEVATRNLGFPIKTVHGLIEGQEATFDSLNKYQKLLTKEVSRYPISLVHRTQTVRIVLCEELVFDGQRRNAIPDFEHGVLYLDVKRGDYNTLYQRKVIHHEFFHLIDYKDDGSVYADKAWAALNPATFQYGTGGRNAQDDATTSELTNRFPGFLNHYSTTGIEEDKAEMFANMMVAPKHVHSRALADPVIKSKQEAMQSLMQKFCPDANEEFWK